MEEQPQAWIIEQLDMPIHYINGQWAVTGYGIKCITSRPLLLSAIAERSRHARQTTLRVASSHAKAGWAASVLSGIARFLRELVQSAEQLTAGQRWRRILAHAVRGFLNGRQLRLPARLMAPT
jgi:hypothetical protein